MAAMAAAPDTTLKVDTEFGAQTIKALQVYLQGNGEDPGEIDSKFGDNSKKAFQSLLIKKGYLNSNIDGNFGKKSITAMQEFLNAEGFLTCRNGDWVWWDTMCLQMLLSANPVQKKAAAKKAAKTIDGCAIMTHATFGNEYLYAAAFDDGDGRRTVAQWMNGGDPEADPASKWNIKKMDDGTFIITNPHFDGNYLYAADFDDGESRRSVYAYMSGAPEDDPQARWLMKELDDGTFAIISAYYEGNYLYAAQKDDGAGRRLICCWMGGGAPEDDAQAKWKISQTVAPGGAPLPPAPPAKKLPAIQWARTVLGPKIALSDDDTTATDEAASPKDGDDGKGRYRVVRSDKEFSSLKGHKIQVKVQSLGRVLLGICTDAVQSDWREGNKKSLHQVEDAWTICLGDTINRWHANKSVKTDLAATTVGATIDIMLMPDKVGFAVEGQGTEPSWIDLPDCKRFVCAAFGGDDTKGASLKLVNYELLDS